MPGTAFRNRIGSLYRTLVVLLVVVVSGNPAFTEGGRNEPVLLLTACFMALSIFKARVWLLTPKFCLISLIFLAILAFQALSFDFYPVVTVIGFICRLFIAYAAFRVVPDFAKVYVRVMFGVCLVGLAFYLPDQLLHAAGIDFRSIFLPLQELVGVEANYHVLLYNFQAGDYFNKNALFFWEPGAAAGYLLLALVFLGLDKKPQRYALYLVVLVVSLLLTMSTTGYIVLPFALLTHYRFDAHDIKKALRSLLLIFASVTLVMAYVYNVSDLEFMKQKIDKQLHSALRQEEGWEINRFGTLLSDWEYIKRRPLLGWGLHENTRYILSADKELGKGQGNGFSGFIAKFGLLGMGTFLFFCWRSFYRLSGFSSYQASIAAFAVILMLNGEAFLNYPLFLSLMFFGSAHLVPKPWPAWSSNCQPQTQ